MSIPSVCCWKEGEACELCLPCSGHVFHLVETGFNDRRQRLKFFHAQRLTHAPDLLQGGQGIQSDAEVVTETPLQHGDKGLLQDWFLEGKWEKSSHGHGDHPTEWTGAQLLSRALQEQGSSFLLRPRCAGMSDFLEEERCSQLLHFHFRGGCGPCSPHSHTWASGRSPSMLAAT